MPNVDEQRGKAATKRAESEQSEEKGDRQEGDGDPKDESEEATAKIKGRSRFTAALRSLSKTKTKRERELDKSTDRETRSAEEEAQETPGELEDVASSISTDSGALGKTKKKSLTRRLLLGGLRKSGKTPKGRPHSLATSDDISVEHLETTPLPSPPGSPTSAGSSTLQITISGKKVEPSPAKKSGKSRPKSDTDYLTPAAEERKPRKKTTTTTVTTRDTSSSTRTTKLLVSKKKPQSPERESPSASPSPLITTTESTRDTPPRERAPAKPSRVQSASGTGAVRKSQSSSASSRKLELMQQQQQRGHRLNARPLAELANTEPQPSGQQSLDPSTSPPAAEGGVSSAESAQTIANPPPVVRFEVGSAVRSPLSAYEAALAAAASQQPNSNEELSDSSIRRLSFAQQQLILGDHDSIEGRRETLHYQSVASEYSNQDSGSEDDSEEQADTTEPENAKPMPAFGDLTMDQEMEPVRSRRRRIANSPVVIYLRRSEEAPQVICWPPYSVCSRVSFNCAGGGRW